MKNKDEIIVKTYCQAIRNVFDKLDLLIDKIPISDFDVCTNQELSIKYKCSFNEINYLRNL